MPPVEPPPHDVDAFLPASMSVYYEGLRRDHFGGGTGSQFTALDGPSEALELAASQRGGLDGDDRQRFVDEYGTDPEAMRADCRYLLVETSGTLGVAALKDLPEGTTIEAVKVKDGAPLSLVADCGERPEVGYGTIIMGPVPEPGFGPECVYTCHPGGPAAHAVEDHPEVAEGDILTVDQVRELYGDVPVKIRDRT